MSDATTLQRLADLLVGFGANVQPGQIVAVSSELGKEPLTRAVAASAYRHGATFVEVSYSDIHVRRARIEYGSDEALETVPPWLGERILRLGDARAARIALTGPVEPGLLEDLDPARVGRDKSQALREAGKVVNERTTNWTIGPCPTQAWASLVHPELEPEAALAKLWEEIVHVCRLDTDDPVAAWRERMATLVGVSGRLTTAGFDAIHFEGPGTDLTIGLLPSSRWICAAFETADGIPHAPNLPSEEVFTTPDPLRADGVVRSTKPLLIGGATIRGLTVRFEGGRAVAIDAEQGAETLREMTSHDDGGARLGELALVDGEGRIGPLGTVFYDTLLDENAASHIALGRGFDFAVGEDDVERVNDSLIHIDFMIGGDDVDVTGITAAGERVPVLRGGAWQL
ncbi:aminopeptidase [Conexibacter sp. JD483]|uniref:aminopeptidase n=1 Tax=unclassified Conexibacter TaxID=2627773 RepID=UPI00271A2457|nr:MULTISPECIES: aminopeptidase [unclassified Conexibacter]MDO8184219.1 aminopeptidase [Conexibacter sp. CPCC 205706]MDO8197211.1 aminopeptidase [Conexibacter sp. CPCC 205762]MDR9367474.1 aminopeptidase [Conexibacter sp. JD483]